MAIVTFDRNAGVPVNLGSATAIDPVALSTQIMALDVYKFPGCPTFGATGPAGCTSTNTADGLKAAGNQFGLFKRDRRSGS